jgi:diguanylate cyclase (GGDEF)-like protein
MRRRTVSYLSNISLRRAVRLFVVVLGILLASTWLTANLLTRHLLNEDATNNARKWAEFLAINVPDLEQIANGELPSVASRTFFEATRKAGEVSRYVIFNRDGYSQLQSDRSGVAPVDLSEFSAQAASAAKTGQPVVSVEAAQSRGHSTYLADAFVPVTIDGRTVATVDATVDETELRDRFYGATLLASVLLSALTGLSFGAPAIAWYRRTQEKQQADRRIRYLAHHDVLTDLPNRAKLIERLEAMLALRSDTGTMLAVHLFDIDRFKQVNDTLGHDGGDFLLSTVGERLRALVRAEDIVARLGGDEFVVVQADLKDKTEAEAFAQRISANLSAPMHLNGQEIRATFTIGVALAPNDGITTERLFKCADLALYAGKIAGRNCIRFFAPDMDEAMQKRAGLEKVVRDAVAQDGLVLHYQPVFEMNGKHLIGFEALARLPAPDGTLIPPATFIPLIEEMRLIDKFGAWVLRDACRTAASWPENLRVAVNLSPSQFRSGEIEKAVHDALDSSGLAPHRLELEITEAVLLDNCESTLATLQRFRVMGISIAMDDFGTGYSSLAYLWKFPFDKIKIDRSFMEGIDSTGHDVETVAKSIIALGREMKMQVTVEGVETPNQVGFLYDADADQVQGFYFGRPMPASEIAANLLKGFAPPHAAEEVADTRRRFIVPAVNA